MKTNIFLLFSLLIVYAIISGCNNDNLSGKATFAAKSACETNGGSCVDEKTNCCFYSGMFGSDDSCSKEGLTQASGLHCCMKAECTDTDGKDANAQGITTGNFNCGNTKKGSVTDYCLDDSSVNEYYCEDGFVKIEKISCPKFWRCSEGRCLYESPLGED